MSSRRVRLSATFRWIGAQVDSGHVVSRGGGSVVVGTLRVGRVDGLRLVANGAAREGIDPVLARALTDAGYGERL